MNFETWMKFFGTSQDDARLKAEIVAAGVKRVPKLVDEETSVQFELKNHGLELVMTDESVLMNLEDQDVGEGPLIMSGVVAKLGKSQGRDVYVGKLPFGVQSDMSQAAVRGILGVPTSIAERHLVDIWTLEDHEIVVRYQKDGQSVALMSVTLPGVEF